jgi:hypothetical protein
MLSLLAFDARCEATVGHGISTFETGVRSFVCLVRSSLLANAHSVFPFPQTFPYHSHRRKGP